MWKYEQPVKIIYGKESIDKIYDLIEEQEYKNGLIITSRFFIKSGIAEIIKNNSKGNIIDIFSEVSPNPSIANVDKCAQVIRDKKVEFIVALGGGSVIDCAKAASVLVSTNNSIRDYYGTNIQLPEIAIPIIAVPTTSGTGSEVTNVSVITDEKLGIKKPLVSKKFFPKYAIVDPELTYTLPSKIVASSGIDVLCHAIEGYWSKGHQPITDALAVYAAKLVFNNLLSAYKNPDDKLARDKLSEASTIAGLAFALPKTTACHACSFLLTSKYDIPHGEACGLTLDFFARINGRNCERVRELAILLGFNNIDEMADAIHELKSKLGLRNDLKDLNLSDEQVEELVKISKHPNLYNNPVDITDEILKEMYESMR